MKNYRVWIALLLIVVMMLSLVSCREKFVFVDKAEEFFENLFDGNKEEETPPEEETPGGGNEEGGSMGIPENDKYEGWGSPIMVQ